jgi:hypothetical protein
MVKTCTQCKTEKALSEFWNDPSQSSGKSCKCKACKQEYKRNRRRSLKEYWSTHNNPAGSVQECSKCKIEKDLSEFHVDRGATAGRRLQCKPCHLEDARSRYCPRPKRPFIFLTSKVCTQCKLDKPMEDFSICNQPHKSGRGGRKSRCKTCARNRRASPEGRAYVNAYYKQRTATDPVFAFWRRARLRLWHFLRGHGKSATTQAYVGCTPEQLRIHLISTLSKLPKAERSLPFNEYHIDHIVPVSAFSVTEAHVAMNWQNLRLLTPARNLKKSNKITEPQTFLPLSTS